MPDPKQIAQQLRAADPEGLADWTDEEIAQAASEQLGQKDSAVSRFFGSLWRNVNPVTAYEGVEGMVLDPRGTARAVVQQSMDAAGRAASEARQGNWGGAVQEAIGVVPLVGPAVVEATNQFESGDIAGGVGSALGLAFPYASVTRMAGRIGRAVAPVRTEALAARASQAGAAKLADAMTPKGGPNKQRFANMANKSSAGLLADDIPGAWTREGLHSEVSKRLEDAEIALDQATDAQLSNPAVAKKRATGEFYDPKPVIASLEATLRELTGQPVDASRLGGKLVKDREGFVTKADSPVGQPVEFHHNAARINEIKRAIAELKQLGPLVHYSELTKMRQAYDAPAKIKYNPATATDYLAKTGEATGASDVTRALRDHLASLDPSLDKANKNYSLYRSADDALKAVAELASTKPTVGRKIMATVAAGTGIGIGGLPGGLAGLLLGASFFVADNAGVTKKIKVAKAYDNFAKAVRGAKPDKAAFYLRQIRRAAGQGAVMTGRALSKEGFSAGQSPSWGGSAVEAAQEPPSSPLPDGEYIQNPDGTITRIR